jgi:hypothetical protein
VPAEGQGICVGADETFFGLPVLVLLELSSGGVVQNRVTLFDEIRWFSSAIADRLKGVVISR